MKRTLTRSRLIAGGSAAVAGLTIVPAPARAADFVYRYGHDQAVSDPINVRAVQMAANVKRETNGRLEIHVFPNSQLGGDPAMIEQVREGALEMSTQSGPLLSGIAPNAGIVSVPYAFKTEDDAVRACNGDLGDAVRKDIAAKVGVHVFPIVLPGGFRQVTTSTRPMRTADDFVGLKLRVPPGMIYAETYRSMGASVVTLPLSDVYVALQTKVVDGEDNPYVIIEGQRFFEVQKYLSVMDAVLSAQFVYINENAWKALPPDLQSVLDRNMRLYARNQQRDNTAMRKSLADKLQRQGLIFNVADRESCKSHMGPLYAKVKPIFGNALWSLLEKYSGKLG